MAAVTVSRSEGGLIAVKQVPAERAADIQREADLLRRLDHPGLVRFVDLVETADGGRALHTEFVNSDTWASRPLADPTERAAGMAALAAVVADLHQLGVAHLQLTPPHVLHGENDLPVLCSLTSAAEATPENRHTDLAALADLCHDPALGRGALSGKLYSLADAAREGTLSARDLARRLDTIATKRPTRTAPVRVAGGGVLDSLKRRCRPKPLLRAGAVVVAVLAAFVIGARSGDPEPPPAAAAPAQDEALGNIAEASPDLLAEYDPVDETGPVAEPGPVSERDLVAEPDPVALLDPITEPGQVAVSVREAAAVIEHGGRRYAMGATGDFVAVGDWDCDGQATAAIVRPSTGGVVLFDTWPGPGGTISLPERWSVDSPTGADAVAHGQCDLLRVYTTGGSKLFNPAEAS
ncbi:MAG: hypothetical protein OXG40_14450 [Acidimicrobiaceae bacterium]|nr:hypothetical protein [Acidimicrobiaceae bacterium]MCY3650941.1 hypothetical protein [Acidimicrobiaceae bacterium]MDE0515139.1 hypothetical protein [Acidimicrobiaceae bacterium]